MAFPAFCLTVLKIGPTMSPRKLNMGRMKAAPGFKMGPTWPKLGV